MLGLGRDGTMSACKTLVCTSLSSTTFPLRTNRPTISLLHSPSLLFSSLPSNQVLRLASYNVPSRPYASISSEAATADFTNEAHSADSTLELLENPDSGNRGGASEEEKRGHALDENGTPPRVCAPNRRSVVPVSGQVQLR
ncbi:hypothetical protein DVH24_002872 [Malus domestica]|uniref:Uncharacterized protein n=1 Tax=Malus domestica TaxID=3750 RepID=A0A498K901_MALDO|nr:hypothetical protein DVH24_002872 [Malus domestica]